MLLVPAFQPRTHQINSRHKTELEECHLFPRTLPHCNLLLSLALVLTHATAAQTTPPATRPGDTLSSRPNDPLNRSAFEHFYNLDYDRAVQDFDQILQRHPDDPF